MLGLMKNSQMRKIYQHDDKGRDDQMALPKDSNVTPAAMGLASASLISALVDELIHSRIVKRDDMLRVIANARRDLHRWSTQATFREASVFLDGIRDNLAKVD
jgi:hypothetical protein